MKNEIGVNHQNEVIEVPRLRFIPFNKPWNKFKLKDVATFINGRAYKQNELLDSGKYRVLRVGNFFTNTSWYFSDLELDDKYYAEEGDLLYTWSASFGPHIWHGEKLIYHYHIWKIELSNRFDKLFATYLLDYDKEKILSDKNGSTMVHITKKGMEEKEVKLPSFSEQTKIGSFFKNLDDTISFHQQELEILKQTKQGFLQKMFPKDGESMPEIRFPVFNDEWKLKKLKEIAEINPKSTLPSEFEYVDLGSVVGTRLLSSRKETKQTAPSRAQRVAKTGDVFYQTVRPYQQNNFLFDLTSDNFVFSTGYAQMRPNIDSYFLLNSLQVKSFVVAVMNSCTGTSYPAINSSDLSQLEIMVPVTGEEQIKIGEFFRQLDEVIELKEKEVEALKETKKGFLQKMFV